MRLRAFALTAFLALMCPVAARADDAAALYDPTDVALIDLTLSDAAQQALIDDPSTYVAATFGLTLGDRSFGPKPAQIKLKGHGSFRPLGRKAAFKVKFAKPDRPFGLKTLTLNNMVQDESMVHETLGYEILRAAGVPTPRTGFAYVRVNEQGYGLYLNLETYDDLSMARLFATTQHLYEADDYGVDVVPGGAAAYAIEEGDEDDRTDLEALITATNAAGSDWSESMGDVADLDEMTRMWAGEEYIGHWDGYSVTAGPYWPNNYFLHSDATGRFSMLPYGLDATFQRVDHPVPGNGDGLLIARCLDDASCLQDFRSDLGAVSAAADEMQVGERLNTIGATVARWRPCPDLEQATDAAWQAAVTGTRAFIRVRRTALAAYLGAPAPASDPALASTAPPPLSAAGCPTGPPPAAPPPAPGPAPVTPSPQPASEPRPALPAAPALVAPAIPPVAPRAPRLLPQRFTARVSPGANMRPPHRFTTSGSLLPPAGLDRAKACTGRVSVRITAGTRPLALRQMFLRRNCTYASSVTFNEPSVFAGRGRLTVQVRFEGNGSLLPSSAATRTVAVRPRDPGRSASRGGT